MIVPLKHQVITLKDAKAFKKQGFPQESLFCYYKDKLVICTEMNTLTRDSIYTPWVLAEYNLLLTRLELAECFAAYTVLELRHILSDRYWEAISHVIKDGFKTSIFHLIKKVLL